MRRPVAGLALRIAACALLMLSVAAVPAPEPPPRWSAGSLAVLQRWVSLAPLDALPQPSLAPLERAKASGDPQALDRAADTLALDLARMQLLGAAGAAERKGWNIADSDRDIDLAALLGQSLEAGTLDAFFASLLPRSRDYAALRTAYASESDPERRQTIAINMERWRWMPHALGNEYVLVNAAAFQAQLWREGREAGSWRVIVGKQSTPTPVFDAVITQVIFNPWWEVPASIVRESVGALVRRDPAAARARGYVWSGGKYRQKPGPNNALGQMKLVMPNPYSVYMHDTPAKELFERDVRAFSHGCIRTQDAIGYAATLLEGAATREEIDAVVASGKTATIGLVRPVPIYIAYFTAGADGQGGVAIYPDIYGRDALLASAGGSCAP